MIFRDDTVKSIRLLVYAFETKTGQFVDEPFHSIIDTSANFPNPSRTTSTGSKFAAAACLTIVVEVCCTRLDRANLNRVAN